LKRWCATRGAQHAWRSSRRAFRSAERTTIQRTVLGYVENYEDVYRLCYVRGPEAMIVELAEEIG
jgi:hypothetical protein